MAFDGLTDAELTALQKRQAEIIATRHREEQLYRYRPYERQKLFHASGATHRERLFMAGNQLGKTLAGGMEVAMHLTGRYPDWWEGRRFDRATIWWVGGVTSEATRDGAERILLGRAGERGTGTVPRSLLAGVSAKQGIPDSIATASVEHSSGRRSKIIFKSYDQGREKWQGDTIDGVWFDEEPAEAIYTEGLTRTNASEAGRSGITMMTFTPLLGMSNVVKRFLQEKSEDRSVVSMTIDDVAHYSDAQKRTIIESYPAWEREARTKGIPAFGKGRVFTYPEDHLSYRPFPFPRHWRKISGMDIGWDHPTAGAWLAYDPDGDCIYVYDTYRQRQQTPVVHAAAWRAKGLHIPVAWPHDALQHDKGSGEQMAQLYRQQGLKMLPEMAQFADDRGNGLEAGVTEMCMRMETGRFRVAEHLIDFWEEYRLYHRDGDPVPKIVKINDDVLSAVRVAVMMLRFARADEDHPTDRYMQRYRSSSSSSAWAA